MITADGTTHSGYHAVRPTPRVASRDPLGLVAGWRAYMVWRDLSSLSESQLAARGLTRQDIPAQARAEIFRAA